jgi:hypothetical protein
MAWLVGGRVAISTPRGSTRRLRCWLPVSRWRMRPGCWPTSSGARSAKPAGGPVAAPQVTTVFTVKLPARLVERVREYAAATGRTISSVVAQALEEFLSRGRRDHPRR